MKKFRATLLLLLQLAVAPFAVGAGSITVSAAASLQDALKEIQALYMTLHPGLSITCNFGASGLLQHQIENGAPVDLFISAAGEQMDALERKGLLEPSSRRNLLRNELVLIVPKARKNPSTFADLAKPDVNRIAIGESATVPAGAYAAETLRALKLFEPLRDKFIYTQDVRQALVYVETGNVDAGFVYATDAHSAPNVRIVAIAPEGAHAPIVYPAALIKNSKSAGEAGEFLGFLSGKDAQAVFEKYGFKPVSPL